MVNRLHINTHRRVTEDCIVTESVLVLQLVGRWLFYMKEVQVDDRRGV